MIACRSTLMALALIAAVPASGAEPAAQRPELFVLSGKCATFRIDDRDITPRCKAELISFTLSNDRVGFIFAVGKMVVTFSGSGADQTPLAGEHASQPIDTLRVVDSEEDPQNVGSMAASGNCVFGNPFAGAATVSCAVAAEFGVFQANFVTDGTPPSRSPM